MIELKETQKTHNIQPQHGHNGTRVSGSFSNLSDSGGRTAARLGLRRRSTVAVGRNDHVSVPRSTAKHSRRRHFGRYGRATWNSASLSRPSHAMSSNSVERCRWRRRVDSASRRPPNNGTQQTARSSHGRPPRAQIV